MQQIARVRLGPKRSWLVRGAQRGASWHSGFVAPQAVRLAVRRLRRWCWCWCLGHGWWRWTLLQRLSSVQSSQSQSRRHNVIVQRVPRLAATVVSQSVTMYLSEMPR
ncbi:uncharacterized protein LOC108142287 [Drosophila elegans]|uniref:uncharacterized protein LOC108142287 n=1 Tax=Drosophila elegans TaxID=30023 RepID=UPI0007E6C6C8|nr:uncharacterized protein LOC108142287 [Drosophila elegans]